MWFSTLAYVTLATAATFKPIPSRKIEQGWGAVKLLFDNPSKITDTIHEEFDSLSASAQHTWYESQFPDTGEFFWDKIIELSPYIKEYANELFHHAVELYPSEKLTELRESMVNISATATVLHKVCSQAAENSGVSLYSVIEEHQDIFIVLFKELMEMFPPPDEAPGHDNRTIMISMALDRIEQSFSQVATKVGISEELLKSHSSPLKFVVQQVAVTTGDLVEQHPDIAHTLLLVAIVEFYPLLLPEIEIGGWLLPRLLRFFGFGRQGPIKGGIAAWLQRWIFGAAIPAGSWFSVLQRLAMSTKL
ncbi:hypothetical protein EV424DRAFT_1420801 [Suillus variegatus]|nr:hypothetical protein EV424DRAFT_1420801 [Suillus variegatus]